MKVPPNKRTEFKAVISKSRISPFLFRRGRRSRASSSRTPRASARSNRRRVRIVTGVKLSTKRRMANVQLQMNSQNAQPENEVFEAGSGEQRQVETKKTPGKAPKTPAKLVPRTPGKNVLKTPVERHEAAAGGSGPVTRSVTVEQTQSSQKKAPAAAAQAGQKRKTKVEVEMNG